MNLTKGEFCRFNLKSRAAMLRENGIMLIKKKIDRAHEIQVFLIYNFYVEVFLNFRHNKILKIEPVLNQNWLDFYVR